MKIEPTEARQMLEDSWFFARTSIFFKNDSFKAINIAFQEGQSSPNIKQLEWMVSEGGETMLANIPFNDYYLIDGTDGMIFLTINNQHHMEIYDTIDEAKTAAQADFKKRIKECLDL